MTPPSATHHTAPPRMNVPFGVGGTHHGASHASQRASNAGSAPPSGAPNPAFGVGTPRGHATPPGGGDPSLPGNGAPFYSGNSFTSHVPGPPGGPPTTDPMAGGPRSVTLNIRPDKKDYPVLNQDHEYHHWSSVFRATLFAHQLSLLLDYDYVPDHTDTNAVRLFNGMNHWIYMVLIHCVCTIAGREIVAGQKRTYDGRRVLYLLQVHYAHSTTTLIATDKQLEWITSIVLDSTHNRKYVEFIIKFDKTMQEYNESVSPTNRLGHLLMKRMLQRAVAPIPAFRQIMNDEAQALVRGQAALTYGEYYALLKAAAETQDAARGTRSKVGSHVHMVQDAPASDVPTSDVDYQPTALDHELDFLVNQTVTHPPSVSVHQTNARPTGPRPRLPEATFSALNPEDRRSWAGMSTDAKAKIVALISNNSKTRVNVAETASPPSGTGDTSPTAASSTDTTPISVNAVDLATKQRAVADAHPGDVRRILAKRPDTKAPSPKAPSAPTPPAKASDPASSTQKHFNVTWSPPDTTLSFLGDRPASSLYDVLATTVDDYADLSDTDDDSNLWYERGIDDQYGPDDPDFR